MTRLEELKDGDIAIIINIHSVGEYSKRLGEMGFIKGRRIKVIKNAPFKDPIEYELMGYSVSLRRSEARLIEVALESELTAVQIAALNQANYEAIHSEDIGQHAPRNRHVINVALIGNPNCGKTTLFNFVSGLNEHVGNFSGITVATKQATIEHRGYKINITDLPGTYSLSSYTAEERVVKQELEGDKYDFIVNVVDATLLERNLYLTTQLMDMARHIVVALNMYDELEVSGDKFDHQMMSSMLDIPFIPTKARVGEGINEVLDMVVAKHEGELPHTHVESCLGRFIEERVAEVLKLIEGVDIAPSLPRRAVAMTLIEGDVELLSRVDERIVAAVAQLRGEIEQEYGDNIEQIFADSRYGYIAGALTETLVVDNDRSSKSHRIDHYLTHRVWGLPIFLGLIWLMFYVTFTLGAYPQEWIEEGVSAVSEWLSGAMSDGALRDLVVDGVIGGVGGVIIFLPNILILFLCISLMEDSGYMSRAAFIMDRMMHKIGLHGKSFVPMIMGFGCNVPAIMASRIIEDRSNRLLTMLIVPFMSCSARLPVYILIVGALFPESASWMLFGIYLFGVLMAILTSLLLKRVIFTNADHPFVMELPPYRLPLLRNTVKHMWVKASQYLKKMGSIILIGAVIIWALGYYPSQEDSYLERIGHTIEPTIEPLGFDWKMGVALISGVAAKEIVVGTLGVLHNIDDAEGEGANRLQEKIKNDRYEYGERKGEIIYTTPVALSFLAFVLLYFPCVAVVAAIRRESGKWRWALFSLFYTTGLAWVVSFIIYRGLLIIPRF
ncbi:MAG: ferrous iron transport protein B [Rikenellaceae bacterium]